MRPYEFLKCFPKNLIIIKNQSVQLAVGRHKYSVGRHVDTRMSVKGETDINQTATALLANSILERLTYS